MKIFKTVLLSLSFIFCIATVSYASENPKAQSQDFKLQQASKALQITGVVKSVNEGAGTITVAKKLQAKTTEVIAVADKATNITKGNEKMSLHDINTGDKVVVVYTRKGEVNLAKSISIK